MPSMKAVIVMNQVGKEGSGMGRLDGGATHALRPGKSQEEGNQAEVVDVHGGWFEHQDAKQPGNANVTGGEGRAGHSTDGRHDRGWLHGDVGQRGARGDLQ